MTPPVGGPDLKVISFWVLEDVALVGPVCPGVAKVEKSLWVVGPKDKEVKLGALSKRG